MSVSDTSSSPPSSQVQGNAAVEAMELGSLAEAGYVRLRAVFTPAEIDRARAQLASLFAVPSSYKGDLLRHPSLGSIRMDVFNREPALLEWLLHPKLLHALRGALGDDFVFLPESAAHMDGFGSWHKDTTSQERAGERFHLAPDFLMLQVAIYLQDNGVNGGGLSVIPGSHLRPDRYVNAIDRTFVDKVRTKLKKWLHLEPAGLRIDSKAGDVVLFDVRLDHRATPSARQRPEPKFALFCIASRRNAHAAAYLRYLRSRPDYSYLDGYAYGPELVAKSETAGVCWI